MRFINITFYILLLNVSIYANNIATITAIRGKADIQRADKNIHATLGSKLKQKDTIKTQDNTKLQLIFKDETIISIGKNSEFSIEEYLFEDNQEPIAKFGMIRGAMRTITGQIGDIAPQKFSVATKTATIGIRGTNFSVFVNDDGSAQAFCTYGAISVRVAGVTHIVQQGFFIQVSPKGKIEIKEFTPKILKLAEEKHFALTEKEKTNTVRNDVSNQNTPGNQNDEQLAITTTDNSGLIITDVTTTTADAIQRTTTGDNILTENSVIAARTQTNIYYNGTYSGTASGPFPASGNAGLEVDFGADSATLYLDTANQSKIYTGFTGLNTNTFTGGSIPAGTGTADGQFFGATGDIVRGNYTYQAQSSPQGQGTYTVQNNGLASPFQ